MPTSTDAERVLEDLVRSMRGLRGALLASVDGRPIAAVMDGHDVASTAAIIASSRGLGERLAELSGEAALQEIVVRSTAGYVVIYTAGPRGVLTVLTDGATNLALLHLRARDLLDDLAAVVDAQTGAHALAGPGEPRR